MNTSDQSFPSASFVLALALGVTATVVVPSVVLMAVAGHVLSKPAPRRWCSSASNWRPADGTRTYSEEGLEELRKHAAERYGDLPALRPLGRAQR